MSSICFVKGDTIQSNYKVFYNKILVKSALDTATQLSPLHFKNSDILVTDSLYIYYSDNNSCDSCMYFVVVIDNQKKYVKVLSNQGQKYAYVIPIYDLKRWAEANKLNIFEIYYYKEKPAFPIHLLKIILD